MEPLVLVYSPKDAYENLLSYFELKDAPSQTTLIAAVLRRLCGFMCPCPPSALVGMACRSLAPLMLEVNTLRDQVETVLEDMIVCGDILELAHVAISGGDNHPHWVYCAPPSYVKRGNRIHLFGVAPDDTRFLPSELRAYVMRDGALRFLDAEPSRTAQLSSLGLREVSADVWLTSTPREIATQVVNRYVKRLESLGVSGALPDVSLLQPATSPRLAYRSRWTPPSNESGHFIGRVPQAFGAPLWYFCTLEAGVVQRSILLPLKESTERANDAAWRLQLAIDATAGIPATYSIRQDTEGTGETLCFDFPLPLAARRRLLILGGRRIEDNPYKFWLPTAELALETTFLREHYWLQEHREK